jgi:adenine-specific DNA-methyltransferase
VQPGGPDALDEDDEWDDEAEEPVERYSKSKSFWWGPELSTDGAKKALKAILAGSDIQFEHPKPVQEIRRIIHMASGSASTVLDSFAGSGTTAQAILEANKEDGGQRRFILVEMEEYANELTAERVRRVIRGVSSARDEALREGLGGSFTYCELGAPIDLEKFFKGEGAPSYEQVARYVTYTATGASVGKVSDQPRRDWFIGEAGGYRIHLIYKPNIAFMRSNDAALTMTLAAQISKSAGDKPVLVYAAQKFMGQAELTKLGITFCQLPYSVYRILGDAPNAA